MAYTRDWTSAIYLSPWTIESGADYTLDSGLYFDGNITGVSYNRTTYETGTSYFSFSIAGYSVSGNSSQRISSGVWTYNNKCLTSSLLLGIINGSLRLSHSFHLYDTVSGGASFVGSSDINWRTDLDGTALITQWHSSGTWYSSLAYNGTDLGTVEYANATYNPSHGSSTKFIHWGELNYGDVIATLEDGTYSGNVTSVAIDRTFWYVGNYNNGSSSGNKDLSSTVLTISPIQQYLYVPTAAGIFNAKVNVTLKNDTDQWGTFTGHAISGTSYNPKGVFYIRDAEVESDNETLYAGFLDYQSISLDALNKTVSFTLNSVMSGLVDKPIVPTSKINWQAGATGDVYGVIYPETVGTVSEIIRDTNENSGTIKVSPIAFPLGASELKENELLTSNTVETDEFGMFRVGSYLGESDGTLSFTVSKMPDWLIVGDQLTRNRAYPESLDLGINGYEFYKDFLRDSAYFYNSANLDAWGGADLNWEISSPAMIDALKSVIISPSMYIYGDEKYIDVLNEFLKAIGGGGCASFDGETVNFFVPSPTYLLQDPAGTLDYETDVYGGYTASKEHPIRSIYVEYAYDYDSRRYLENVTVQTDFDYGIDKKISTWLINYNEDARNMAFFTSAYFSSGAILQTVTDTSHWSKLMPGNVVQVNNIPSEFEVNGSLFLVTSRTFDPSSKLVMSLLQEISLEVRDFFRVGVHYIGRSTGVL